MALTYSQMLPLGSPCPNFSLPDADGKPVSSLDFAGRRAVLVMFICNHCPYVKHIQKEVARLAKEYQAKGVGVIAINSNDVERYPEDSPAKMRQEIQRLGYTFPYLLDETQAVAKLFKAACTPEFYVFNMDGMLAYRGRFDGSSPGNSTPVTGQDVRAALDAVLTGRPAPENQEPSMGCNIKWKPGNEPRY